MKFIHHLARTGGTVISRCIAAMPNVCLLSEIHPHSLEKHNPLKQAAQWYELVTSAEVKANRLDSHTALEDALRLIESRCQARGLTLVIRDGAQHDWIGNGAVTPPALRCSWDDLVGAGNGHLIRLATVRHPLDQFLALQRTLKKGFDELRVWQGMREFANWVGDKPRFRFEDFLFDPEQVLRQICHHLCIDYDDRWRQNWSSIKSMTGDKSNLRTICPKERVGVQPGVWKRLRDNEDFHNILDWLGYPLPEPMRGMTVSIPKPVTNGFSKRRTPNTLLLKDFDEEVVRCRAEVAKDPESLPALLRLVAALRWIGHLTEATELMVTAVGRSEELPPKQQTQILVLYCDLLNSVQDRFAGIEARRRLAELIPANTHNLFELSLLLVGIGEVDEALTYSRRLLEIDQENQAAAANFLLYINYSDRYTPSEISNEHFRLAMRFMERPKQIPKRLRKNGERIRLGYMASDFYTHPVGKLMLPILAAHNREAFEIFIYHHGKKSDTLTQSTKQLVDHFQAIAQWPDERVVEKIRADELDLIVDLGGYSGGGNRLNVLAQRVAPVEVSYLGYPNTSALRTIDYHLTDRFCDPPGMTEHLYGERLVWLDHSHLAWQPHPQCQAIEVDRPSVPTLGMFNNVAKVSPTALNAYASIMRRVPETKLVFKYGDRFGVRSLRNRYRAEFARRGVLPHRLEFRGHSVPLTEHLRTMAGVDLALDAIPYQGTMTSLECLSVGTPIVSCCGAYYAHRATSAMMMRLGLHELVASEPDEYVEIAVQLLQDLPGLRQLRAIVKERFYTSPLTDPGGLTRELEAKMKSWV